MEIPGLWAENLILLQGGVADYQTAARLVIQDWNAGRIPYYTIPPETDPSIHVGAEIVNTWGEAFKLDGLYFLF